MAKRKVIVTGGAGFIGCNAVRRYVERGDPVVVVDNLSRRGADKNLEWLRGIGKFALHSADIRDAGKLSDVFKEHNDAAVILHLAGQVAVTTSVLEPREDFENNALGTFNVLEAARAHTPEAIFIYSSTNKVYGGLDHLETEERDGRYQFKSLPGGVDEKTPLDFHSPYGCSKGAADQYVRDYSRIYNLRTVCMRQSCIYGYRQFGVEDQGWVAWFTIAAVLGKPLTLYGDGKQVRDVLFVEDLCALYERVVERIDRAAGQVYNVGGGPRNQISLLDLLAHLEQLVGRKIPVSYDAWRPGDQPVFVCDISKAERDLDWTPAVPAHEGVERLHRWVSENRTLF